MVILRCTICSRESSEELCDFHTMTYERLRETFKRWECAMEITWEGFLEEVKQNSNSGSWAREVAVYILKKEGS